MKSKMIARAIALIATENGMTLDHGIYIDAEGERYVPTHLGLSRAEPIAYKKMYFALEEDYDEVAISNLLLKKQVGDLLADRRIGWKSTSKIKKILKSNTTYKEKVIQIAKYLNLGMNGIINGDTTEREVCSCAGGGRCSPNEGGDGCSCGEQKD